MAHFAEIDNNGYVLQVIVISNKRLNGKEYPESEPIGQAFIRSLGYQGQWLQTSYNAKFRGNYAGRYYRYDADLDAFIPPKPHDKWTLKNYNWVAPKPIPDNENEWYWSDSENDWVTEPTQRLPLPEIDPPSKPNQAMYFNPTTKQLTSRPRIPNVSNPSEATILSNGWVVYVNEPPTVSEGERAVPTEIDANGVQQYRIEPIPPTILDRLTKLELKRALFAINRADVWQTLEGLVDADPEQLTPLQRNMRDWMRFGTFIDRNDDDMDALEQAFNLDRNEVFLKR